MQWLLSWWRLGLVFTLKHLTWRVLFIVGGAFSSVSIITIRRSRWFSNMCWRVSRVLYQIRSKHLIG